MTTPLLPTLTPTHSGSMPAVNRVHHTSAIDLLKAMPSGSVNCIVTSPPYFGLRDYGVDGQIGLESTPREFIDKLTRLFREARRVLRDDGTLWANMGDSYVGGGGYSPDSPSNQNGGSLSSRRVGDAGGRTQGAIKAIDLPAKNLLGIPWRLAFALQDDGWILRSDIIWHKPNPMPESVTDRPTKSHEYVFLFAKSAKYWYDADAIREPAQPQTLERDKYKRTGYAKENRDGFVNHLDPNSGEYRDCSLGRNKRSVWSISTEANEFAHFATFPQKLIEPMILAGCPKGGLVLDPFMGSGTTALVARANGRNYIGSELNGDYVAIARERLRQPYEQHYITRESAPMDELPLFAANATA